MRPYGKTTSITRLIKGEIKRRWAGSAGFTLVEAAVALSILSLGVLMVGQGIFQSLSVQRFWQDDVVATKDLRHASSYVAGDALIAQSIDLNDGVVADCIDGTPCVELRWTDGAGTPHTVAYLLVGDTLVRDLDGVQNPIAPRVAQVTFSRTGQTVSFFLEVAAERGGTDTINLQTYLRKLI
ncbi:MAG TPA: prepilin-type N-terminal cleavage/methylation domain-containing protein [Dehalococcoidia bacterium]|nr:prepilin-type N-terminal cleavage/methylation domain-containing protein [Dehalococcoidia bacterium]